jgi:hypothetical protein
LRAPYELIVLGREIGISAEKHDVMMLTALPLVWGESGPLDPASRPAASYEALREEFSIRPLDTLDAHSLATGKVLLLAQPRALTPSELVALDSWIRRGGRALILTDPLLMWPSELPLGDIRRAPAIGLLGPLLNHWGLEMVEPAKPSVVVEEVPASGMKRRLAMFAPGRFIAEGSACSVGNAASLARCRLGTGRAILLADADMMHDRLWVGPGRDGIRRHARISDNPLLVADWLDELAGARRPRARQRVEWLDKNSPNFPALLLALLPILIAAAPAATFALPGRPEPHSSSPDLSTGSSN